MPHVARRSYRLIVIGHGSASGYFAPGEQTQVSPASWPFLASQLDDGAVVVDVRPAVDEDVGTALRSPYVDPYLPAGAVRSPGCDPRVIAAAARAYWRGDASSMLGEGTGQPFTAFDHVATDLYVAYWQRHGALVARHVDGRLAWETAGADAP